MADQIRLPIKVVIPDRRQDYVKPTSGGGPKKKFGSVDQSRRNQINDQISEVNEYFSASFRDEPNVPAVARVFLKDKALAKSHRPKKLFDKKTWPIIGGQNFGELLVSVRPQAFRRLSQRILQSDSAETEANLSTIESIEPYMLDDALSAIEFDSTQHPEQDLKFRLFHHNDPDLDANILKAFYHRIEALRLEKPVGLQYGGGLQIYRIPNLSERTAHELASFVGTHSLSRFPVFHSVRTQAIPVRAAEVTDFPGPVANVSYPLVGIIDTGVNDSSLLLSPWVHNRELYVPESLRDHTHGSFVAGLICNAHRLNHSDIRFPEVRSKIVDIVAMPINGLREDQLMVILEKVIPQNPDVKVWNLSIGSMNAPCRDDEFSDLAIALDRLQDTYGVTFVFAAGNFGTPFRSWPPADLGEHDRICPPADSARGLTVSAIAHEEKPNSAVKREEPAPYSRRGPGAAYLVKPDLAHYGGNCTNQGQYAQMGVLSLDGNDNLSEAIGTSFAAPLISTLLANIIDAFQTQPSRSLAKALLVHSAVLNDDPLTTEKLRYKGFGVPGNTVNVLSCTPWSATLVFEPEVVPDLNFVKNNFPIPKCLRTPDGKVFGEFIMTVVSEPALDARFGAEYCRVNVAASLGTYDSDQEGINHHNKKLPEEPRDINQMYERELIEAGFKWSPVKVYRRLIKRGIEGKHWRLLVKAQSRANHFNVSPTPTAILVTLRDPTGKLPVYDEVIQNMAISGWVTEDIRIEERVRLRLET